MKIVCDSCGAKYSIADEKVAGKVFKIRCKKCSAVIVVKGDNQEEGGDEATRVYDYGSEAVWHVVVGGDQQGPLAPRQLGEMLAEGKIDWEAYVWREGMDGWQPAKDVEPLVNAITESEGAPSPAAGRASQGQVFGGSSDMGADPFAGNDDGGLSGVMGQSSASAAAAGGSADLFAQSARSPFAGSTDDDDHVSNGKSSPRVVESEAMTGQRNENSVLFSLSNLQALATGSSSAPVSNRPKPGMAQGEGSGLIDIRALASATQAVAERPANGSSREKVEDLLAMGSAGTAFSAATLAAPVAAEKSDSSKMMMGMMGGAILLLGAAVGYLALREPAAPQAVAAAVAADPAGAGAPAAAAAAAQAAAVPPPSVPAEAEAPTKTAPPSEAADEDREDSSGSRSDRSKPRRSGGSDSPAPAKAEKPAAVEKAESPAPAAAAAKQSSGDKSIDDLLDGALNGKPAKAAPKPAANENLASTPSRDDVLSAMKGVTARVQACGNGQSGIAMSKIGVAGPTGRVTSVDVSGQFAGTPVAACIVKEVSKAKFPKFSQSSFSFSYPFKI